jgi:hypothetical protein
MSSRSRSPSPREFAGGRRASVPPRRNMWAVRQVRVADAIASARIQQFGTTVIPCAPFLGTMDHFDGTRSFGLMNDADRSTWYTLVQMNQSDRNIDIDLMDIDVGREFDINTMQLLVVPRRDDRTRTCIDLRITCCDRACETRRRVQHICDKDIFMYVFDDQGLLNWRYENGTLYISQFSSKPREGLILQGLDDTISRYEENDIQGIEHMELLLMRRLYTDECVGPREIMLATIRVSDYFDGAPTNFILEKGRDKIIIKSCGYVTKHLQEYLMKPDEAQFVDNFCRQSQNNVAELTGIYDWINGGQSPYG